MQTRRIVTGHDKAGKSVFVSDAQAPRTTEFRHVPGFITSLLWETTSETTVPASSGDPAVTARSWVPESSGRAIGGVAASPGLAIGRLHHFQADHIVVKDAPGIPDIEWQKLRERNEALDARVYARAAAWIAGTDRWSEARWADLEAQLGCSDEGAETPTPGGAVRPVRQVLRRRSLRSSYMG